METTNNEQMEKPRLNFVSEAFLDAMEMVLENGALDQLVGAVRSDQKLVALSLIDAIRILLNDRVVLVLQSGLELSQMKKMAKDFEGVHWEGDLKDARRHLEDGRKRLEDCRKPPRGGVGVQGAAP